MPAQPAYPPGAPALTSPANQQPGVAPAPAAGLPPGGNSQPASPSFFGVPLPAVDSPTPEQAIADNPRVAEILRSSGDNLVFVEGSEGQGSAFLCLLNGKRVLLSNQHVIRGNPNIHFTTLNQAQIKAGAARAAVGHDLIAYDAPEALSPMEAVTDFTKTVTVGDDVVVLGNTEGARVIKPLLGKVVGIGPNLVEITSAFMPGNSGSPIVHLKSGKVIGIATYAVVRSVNSLTNSREKSVRRFGYRIDTVQSWQPVHWPLYQAESAAMKKVADFSGAIVSLLSDLNGRQFDPSKYTDIRLTTALSPIRTMQERRNMNIVDRKQLVKTFLSNMRYLTRKDVDPLQNQLRYDFFRRELAEETKFREEIYNALGEGMKQF